MPRRKTNAIRLNAIHQKICTEISERENKKQKCTDDSARKRQKKCEKHKFTDNFARRQKQHETWFIKRRAIRQMSQYTFGDKKGLTPHPLIVIGMSTFSKIRKNSVVLCGMRRVNINSRNYSDGGELIFKSNTLVIISHICLATHLHGATWMFKIFHVGIYLLFVRLLRNVWSMTTAFIL